MLTIISLFYDHGSESDLILDVCFSGIARSCQDLVVHQPGYRGSCSKVQWFPKSKTIGDFVW